VKRVWLLFALLLVDLVTRSAAAHPAPHSVILLDLRAHDVGAELRLPVPELEAALGRDLRSEGSALIERERSLLRAMVLRDLHVGSLDGAAWTIEVGPLASATDSGVPVVVVEATFTPPAAHAPGAFEIVDDVIGRRVQNHNAWIAVRSDFARGVVTGEPQVVGVTGYLRHTVVVNRTGGSSFRGFQAILRLGMQHIAEGTDHLLFLLTLLLPAPLVVATRRRRWGAVASTRATFASLLRVVTAFSVGHSLTLAAGSLGWLRLPSSPVETFIALSILVSAAHALVPLFPRHEAWIAGAFGFVHGAAFAGALADLHLEGGRLALALLGFNLGIESMQLVIVGAAFPWLVLLARTNWYSAFRTFSAFTAIIAALGWLGQRALGLRNPIEPVLTGVAAHPAVLLASLASLVCLARLASSRAAADSDQSARPSNGVAH
jgi:HupE / UreJ protein